MTTFNDLPVAVIDVTYHEPALDYGEVDSVIFYNTITGGTIPTADGQPFFSIYENIGTTSTKSTDSIYKVYVSVFVTCINFAFRSHFHSLSLSLVAIYVCRKIK